MNRREFLRRTMAVAVAAALPALSIPLSTRMITFRRYLPFPEPNVAPLIDGTAPNLIDYTQYAAVRVWYTAAKLNMEWLKREDIFLP